MPIGIDSHFHFILIDDNSNMQMEPDTSNEHILTENVVAEIIVSSNRSSEHDETSSSSLNMLSNLKNKEVLLQEQHIEDSSSPHSSLSSSDAGKFQSLHFVAILLLDCCSNHPFVPV